MKKLLTIIALVGATNFSFGQGYVRFANDSFSRFSTNGIGDPSGSGFRPAAAAPVGSFYFALFAAPSTQNTISTLNDPTLNGWTYVAIGTNTTQAGRLDGNNFEFNGVNYNAVACPGFAAGTTADFAVAGWSASIGSTWAQAAVWWNNGQVFGPASGWFGINPTVANDILLVSAPGPYNVVFGNSAGLLSGWGLSSWIPEPSSSALAGLGAAALVIFRRRR